MNKKIETLRRLVNESTTMMRNLESEIKEIEHQNFDNRVEAYHHFRDSLMPLTTMLTSYDSSIKINIPKDMCMWDYETGRYDVYKITVSDMSIGVISCDTRHSSERTIVYLDDCNVRMDSYFKGNKFHKVVTNPAYDLESLISYITDDFTQQLTNRINDKINTLNQRYEDATSELKVREYNEDSI